MGELEPQGHITGDNQKVTNLDQQTGEPETQKDETLHFPVDAYTPSEAGATLRNIVIRRERAALLIAKQRI